MFECKCCKIYKEQLAIKQEEIRELREFVKRFVDMTVAPSSSSAPDENEDNPSDPEEGRETYKYGITN